MKLSAGAAPGFKLKYSPTACQRAYNQIGGWNNNQIRREKRPWMFVVPMQGAAIILGEMSYRIEEDCTYRAVDVTLYDENDRLLPEPRFDYWPIEDWELKEYAFCWLDDVADSMQSFAAGRERLAAHGAPVHSAFLVDKTTSKRLPGYTPGCAPLQAEESDWLVGEGMNTGKGVEGQRWRMRRGVWVKDQ